MKTPPPETLADIVREMRSDTRPYALDVAKQLDNADGDKVLNFDAAMCLRDDCKYLFALADRIEAAAKRERDEAKVAFESAIKAAEETARQEGATAALVSARANGTANAPGNAAAMREALAGILRCCRDQDNTDSQVREWSEDAARRPAPRHR